MNNDAIDPMPPKQELPPCCPMLRCKQMYYEGRKVEYTDTTVFWCAKTAFPLGPDNDPVEPKICQPGRSCYVPQP